MGTREAVTGNKEQRMKVAQTGNQPKVTYSWLCGDQKCDTMDCYKDSRDYQTVCGLWEAEPSAFHDQDLAQATKKINAILSGIEKSNRDKKRKLSFIKFENRLMLVWAGYGVVGPEDDFETIEKTLKLRAPSSP